MQIPVGHCGRVIPRSSIGLTGITIHHGLIDSDYTGEIMIIIENTTDKEFEISHGQRIA